MGGLGGLDKFSAGELFGVLAKAGWDTFSQEPETGILMARFWFAQFSVSVTTDCNSSPTVPWRKMLTTLS
jgi:hypothetical protein